MRRKEKGISLELRSHWFNCKRITTTTMTTNRMKIVRLHSYLILIVHDPANQITIITHAHASAQSTQRKKTIFAHCDHSKHSYSASAMHANMRTYPNVWKSERFLSTECVSMVITVIEIDLELCSRLLLNLFFLFL